MLPTPTALSLIGFDLQLAYIVLTDGLVDGFFPLRVKLAMSQEERATAVCAQERFAPENAEDGEGALYGKP
jgi:hypothetical protein